MHAKCVVIDGLEALVTSANFTEAAQTRNIELGLLIEDSLVPRRIEELIDSLIRDGNLAPLSLVTWNCSKNHYKRAEPSS